MSSIRTVIAEIYGKRYSDVELRSNIASMGFDKSDMPSDIRTPNETESEEPDESDKESAELCRACNVGDIHKVTELLNKADPSYDNNTAIWLASEANRPDIVELLMADPRVDPSANNNIALKSACEYGLTNVVYLLLRDKRVIDAGLDESIEIAQDTDHDQITQILKNAR